MRNIAWIEKVIKPCKQSINMTSKVWDSYFESINAAVVFVDCQYAYPINENLVCKFVFNDYAPQEGDKIAIFILGWTSIREYLVFENVPKIDPRNREQCVIFNGNTLPKDEKEIFQFCYISIENVLHGVSSPFQFINPNTQSFMKSSLYSDCTESLAIEKTPNDSLGENEIVQRLKDENAFLRESLRTALCNNKSDRQCKNSIKELREVTDNLKSALEDQNKELELLKIKIGEVEAKYQKLAEEKFELEEQYEKLVNFHNIGDTELGELEEIPPFPLLKM